MTELLTRVTEETGTYQYPWDTMKDAQTGLDTPPEPGFFRDIDIVAVQPEQEGTGPSYSEPKNETHTGDEHTGDEGRFSLGGDDRQDMIREVARMQGRS